MRKPIVISGAMVSLMISISISTPMAHASEVWVQQARTDLGWRERCRREQARQHRARGRFNERRGVRQPHQPSHLQPTERLLARLLQRDAADKRQMKDCREPFARHDVYSGKGKAKAGGLL